MSLILPERLRVKFSSDVSMNNCYWGAFPFLTKPPYDSFFNAISRNTPNAVPSLEEHFFITNDGLVDLLGPDGQKINRYRLDEPINGPDVVLSENIVYSGEDMDTTGRVYLFEVTPEIRERREGYFGYGKIQGHGNKGSLQRLKIPCGLINDFKIIKPKLVWE